MEAQGKQAAAGRPPGNRLAAKLIAAAVVCAGAGFVVFVWRIPAKPDQGEASEQPVVNVTVEVVRALPELADSFVLPGVVEPNRVVKVAAEVPGRIERINCTEGRPCKAKAVLILLNTDLLKAQYDRAKAQAEYDRREHKRMIEFRARGVATDSELDLAASKAAASAAALTLAEAQLDRTTILAPISGILNKLPVEVGEYVDPGTVVAEIVEIDTVKVIVEAPEFDVHRLKVGQKETILVDSLGDVTRTGTIAYIDRLADESTRTTRVEIAMDNRDGALRSGQIVRARLLRRVLRDAIMIPLEAVIPLEHGYAVYVEEAGVARRREVKLGLLRGARVQVVEGLRVGDRLICSGHRYVGPGQPVRVVGGDGPATQATTGPAATRAAGPPAEPK